MAKIYEDFRQPWETGAHWELKREFIEKYQHDFAEDRLLCLAQAYSNIELLNCSYPDPVMRQIHELSKPLKACKRFREYGSRNPEQNPSKSHARRRKFSSPEQDSDRAVKMMKISSKDKKMLFVPSGSEGAITAATSIQKIMTDKNNFESIRNKSALSVSNEVNQSASVSIKTSPPISNLSQGNGNVCDAKGNNLESKNLVASNFDETLPTDSEVIDKIGHDLLQNFVQELRKYVVKGKRPIEAIYSAAQVWNMQKMISYIYTLDHNSQPHEPRFCCTFSIKNVALSHEIESQKKKARLKAAESAATRLFNLNFIQKCSNDELKAPQSEITEIESFSSNEFSETQVMFLSVSGNISEGSPHEKSCVFMCPDLFDMSSLKGTSSAQSDDLQLIRAFIKIIKNPPAVSMKPRKAIEYAAKSLHVQDLVSFRFHVNPTCHIITMFCCQFFIKNILIASKNAASKKSAEWFAAVTGFEKLMSSSNFVIKTQEQAQKELQKKVPAAVKFEVNHQLLKNSIKRGFVLYDNSANRIEREKNPAMLLSGSAAFCQKTFSYNVERSPVIAGQLSSVKADCVLDGSVVGSGEAYTIKEAKALAAASAVEQLRKFVYIIKVKKECLKGFFLINRHHVDDEINFKEGALTNDNVGWKMLESMGWTSGCLGKNGITEPIPIPRHTFGEGLGFAKGSVASKRFKKRIENLLFEFRKSMSFTDLIFSKEFSKEERKTVHAVASMYKLHSVSRGVLKSRYLTVKRKYTGMELLKHLVKSGGSTEKFKLLDESQIDS